MKNQENKEWVEDFKKEFSIFFLDEYDGEEALLRVKDNKTLFAIRARKEVIDFISSLLACEKAKWKKKYKNKNWRMGYKSGWKDAMAKVYDEAKKFANKKS